MTVSSQPVSQIDKMGNKTCNIRKKVHENLIKRDIIASYISFSPYAIKVERVISHVICSKTVFLWKDATLILKASFLIRRR